MTPLSEAKSVSSAPVDSSTNTRYVIQHLGDVIYEIDKAIESGNINFIRNAIKDFGHLIDHSYVEWANSISLQIVEEKIEDMDI